MPEAVIVSSVRTPVGRAYKGALRATRPDDLAAHRNGFLAGQLLGPEHREQHPALRRVLLSVLWPEELTSKEAVPVSGKVVGTRGSQRAFVGAAYGSADGRNNYGFRHGNL